MTRALQAMLLLTWPFVVGCASLSWYYEPAVYQITTDLPLGSSRARVDFYLSQHQIEHSYYRNSNQVMATIRNVRRDALVQQDLTMIFSFDAYGRLGDILVKPAYTAP